MEPFGNESSRMDAVGRYQSVTTRRLFLKGVAAAAVGHCLPVCASRPATIRFGTTPVFLDEQVSFLSRWGDYLQRRVGRPVVFVQRGSYREISDLLLKDEVEFAWICGFPYCVLRPRVRIAAVPNYNGRPVYQSYVIVPQSDTRTRTLMDLRGSVYAFSDPDSNSGWLVPNVELAKAGLDSATFFRKSFFTWAHRKVVEAVSTGLAQGGSVDGYVWETLAKQHPALTARTRVAWKFPFYGFPPIVTRSNLSEEDSQPLRTILLAMNKDPEGQQLLEYLNLDGFVDSPPSLFDPIARNAAIMGRLEARGKRTG